MRRTYLAPPPPPELAAGLPLVPTACFWRLSSPSARWFLSFSARSRYSSTLERMRSRSFWFFSYLYAMLK